MTPEMSPHAPARPSPAALRSRLEESRAALMHAIAGLDEEGFRARPERSEWTAAEVLAHLLSAEQRLMDAAPRALASDHFVLAERTEEERRREAKEAQRLPVPQLVHGLLAGRRETLRLLEGLRAAHLTRPLRHARLGELTLGWLFEHLAEHEEEHAAQIRDLRRRVKRGNSPEGRPL